MATPAIFAPAKPVPPPVDTTCELLGPVLLGIQVVMALLLMLTLVAKRQFEVPRRRWRVWWFDVLKQWSGLLLIHFANLFGSIWLNQGVVAWLVGLPLPPPPVDPPSDLDPCDWYFLSTLFDTTVGVVLLYYTLRVMYVVLYAVLPARVHRLITLGEYYDEEDVQCRHPRARFYFRQLVIYCTAVVLTKGLLYVVLVWYPALLDWFSNWCLWWLDRLLGTVRVFFVVCLFPVVMNAIDYYLIDTVIRGQGGREDPEPLVKRGEDEEEEGYGATS